MFAVKNHNLKAFLIFWSSHPGNWCCFLNAGQTANCFLERKTLAYIKEEFSRSWGGGGGRKDSTCLKSDISKSAFTDMPCFQFFAIVFHF